MKVLMIVPSKQGDEREEIDSEELKKNIEEDKVHIYHTVEGEGNGVVLNKSNVDEELERIVNEHGERLDKVEGDVEELKGKVDKKEEKKKETVKPKVTKTPKVGGG